MQYVKNATGIEKLHFRDVKQFNFDGIYAGLSHDGCETFVHPSNNYVVFGFGFCH